MTTNPLPLEQGSVCHYFLQTKNNNGTLYEGNRFFIILNANPITDNVLVLVTITTKIQNQTKHIANIGESPNTFVHIAPADFSPLRQESGVNCNNLYEITLKDLVARLKTSSGKLFSEKMPRSIISALISGVMQSSQVSQRQKKMLI